MFNKPLIGQSTRTVWFDKGNLPIRPNSVNSEAAFAVWSEAISWLVFTNTSRFVYIVRGNYILLLHIPRMYLVIKPK